MSFITLALLSVFIITALFVLLFVIFSAIDRVYTDSLIPGFVKAFSFNVQAYPITHYMSNCTNRVGIFDLLYIYFCLG